MRSLIAPGLAMLFASTSFAGVLQPQIVLQRTAEPPIAVPATRSCTETVLTHLFANSYYSPGFGAHAASKCPGPWSAVVLGVDVSVSGVQFDRIFDVYAGPVLLFSSSTSEPASFLPNAVTKWHVGYDVSRFAGLLATNQPITMILNNVNDSQFTGQYQVSVTLTFYATDAKNPAARTPDLIIPILPPNAADPTLPGDYGGDGYAFLTPGAPTYVQTVTLPRNLLFLHADLYAQGHGACEEFWWAAPSQCGVGTPLRQVVISIDGTIAGFAPVYPVVFTGGGGPGSWSPIPSPRAWHLDPYRVDLTPFAGRLTDGLPHRFMLTIPDAAYSDPGDFWLAGATLLVTVDHGTTQTTGQLTSAPVAAAATETATPGADLTGVFDFTASRTGTWTGFVNSSTGRVDTSFSSTFDLGTEQANFAATDSTWHWTTVDRTTRAGGLPLTKTVARTYLLRAPPAGGGEFKDAATFTASQGSQSESSTFNLDLRTLGAVEANVDEAENYQATDSSGLCDHREMTASGGYVTSYQTGLPCL